MEIRCSGIVNGYFLDKYGKRGSDKFKGVPSLSVPVQIVDAPADTVCYALVLDDKDAVEVCGFTWIHWLVANFKTDNLEENASMERSDLLQGVTSEHSAVASLSVEDASRYGGMAPPDKAHRYDLTVYALDKELNLESGFTYNKLWYAMQGHIIDQSTVTGIYEA